MIVYVLAVLGLALGVVSLATSIALGVALAHRLLDPAQPRRCKCGDNFLYGAGWSCGRCRDRL